MKGVWEGGKLIESLDIEVCVGTSGARQGGLLIEFAEVLHSLTNAQIWSLQREGERECGFSL